MSEIKFNITNNPWINNGLVRLIIELKKRYSNEVLISKEDNNIIISSNNENNIEYYLNAVIQYLASFGTYNFSQIFKSINKHLNESFSPSCSYPKENKDSKEKMEISKEIRNELKKHDKRSVKSKEQIWKMRLSYISNFNNYLKYGLSFDTTKEFAKLLDNECKKNVCPNCGMISKNLVATRQSFNPLINEHHNNENDGFSSNFRKNNKLCPNCFYLSLISVFDKYIPFYMGDKGTNLVLPNIHDLDILKKIANNLSTPSQFINFSDSNIINYNTNIKEFIHANSDSAALLSLLHNIQNNFSKKPVDNFFQAFTDAELMEIVDWVFINKDSFSITRITADNNVYKILKEQKDNHGQKVYLINDFFNKINFNVFNPFQIEKFFNSFLKLDDKKISLSLFEMVKSDVSFYGSSPIFLFKEVFLNQIMGEILMLDEEYKKACKSIAETIGNAFYMDIGLLSKFAYATDEQSFKEYIEEAFFLLAKKSALENKVFYSNNNELGILFENLNENSFKETKSYFVSFMSSGALFKKYTEKKNDKKE